MDETFRGQLRKKVLDLKPEIEGSYTELYNLVSVLMKLNPEVLPLETDRILQKRMELIYSFPDRKRRMSLPQLEQLFFRYKNDPNLRIRSRTKTDLNDVKKSLDKTRQDLLFFLGIIEDRPKDYSIISRK
ncbi:MAG TPA: hypothetical protein VMW25_00235 [Clostridia bacterium]|nr:hypothetical protein [Clostridia bacterium]